MANSITIKYNSTDITIDNSNSSDITIKININTNTTIGNTNRAPWPEGPGWGPPARRAGYRLY